MKNFVVVLMGLVASSAYADGFVCQTPQGDLNVKVYNHVRPEDGTRNASVMVLSDPRVEAGRKTIARFTDINETLMSKGARYQADVDLRFSDSSRKGELIGGTKLGALKSIELEVDFTYSAPVARDTVLPGNLTLVKRNGEVIEIEDLDCTRYLKQ